MKRVTKVSASNGKDTVTVTITSKRAKAVYEAHEVDRHHNDIVDDAHASLAKKYRVRDIVVK